MMYSQGLKTCWVLLLVIIAGVRGGDIPLILWEEACNSYEVSNGVYPRGPQILSQPSTPLAQCRSLCTVRRDCGGFVSSTANQCHLFNINDNIIDQYLSQNWYGRYSVWTWYSKTCHYSLGNTDLSCDSYYTDIHYHNMWPGSNWKISNSSWYIPDLLATECQAWCTLYTECRSVTYRRHSNGYGACTLYNTTVQHLLDSGLDSNVTEHTGTDVTYTAYDRYCVHGTPYIPVKYKDIIKQNMGVTIKSTDIGDEPQVERVDDKSEDMKFFILTFTLCGAIGACLVGAAILYLVRSHSRRGHKLDKLTDVGVAGGNPKHSQT